MFSQGLSNETIIHQKVIIYANSHKSGLTSCSILHGQTLKNSHLSNTLGKSSLHPCSFQCFDATSVFNFEGACSQLWSNFIFSIFYCFCNAYLINQNLTVGRRVISKKQSSQFFTGKNSCWFFCLFVLNIDKQFLVFGTFIKA